MEQSDMTWERKFTMRTPQGKEIGATYDVDSPHGFWINLKDINSAVNRIKTMAKRDGYNVKDIEITMTPHLDPTIRSEHFRMRGRVFKE